MPTRLLLHGHAKFLTHTILLFPKLLALSPEFFQLRLKILFIHTLFPLKPPYINFRGILSGLLLELFDPGPQVGQLVLEGHRFIIEGLDLIIVA